MAKRGTVDAAEAAEATEVRVLRACQFGNPDDVVILSGSDLAAAVDAGCVDPHPDAVAYARSLVAAEPGS